MVYLVSTCCNSFGYEVLRISEVFEVSVALERFGSTDLTSAMAVNSSRERFLDF